MTGNHLLSLDTTKEHERETKREGKWIWTRRNTKKNRFQTTMNRNMKKRESEAQHND